MYWSKRMGDIEWPFDSSCRTSWMNQKDWTASQNDDAGCAGTFWHMREIS